MRGMPHDLLTVVVAAYNEGDSLPIKVRRGTDPLTLHGVVRLVERVEARLEADPRASAKAARVRHGIFSGTVDR